MRQEGKINRAWLNVADAFRSHASVKRKALRDFGFIMTTAFLIVAFLPVIKSTGQYRPAWLMGAAAFLIPALIRPALLKPLYQLWMLLGGVLGFVNTRIILGVIYFVLFTPLALALRLMGKDILSMRYAKGKESYLVRPNLTATKSFKRQF